MSMSDCEKCWDTPCTCGWEYRHWTKQRRVKLVAAILGCAESRIEDLCSDIHPILAKEVNIARQIMNTNGLEARH